MNKIFCKIGFVVLSFFLSAAMASCSKKNADTIVIWTDKSEIASYVELFNVSQDECKAIVVYKKNLTISLPPEKGEKVPDIVIGTLLKNENTKRNFLPINYLFHNVNMKKNVFYPELLNIGCIGKRQYLLPVSFNLPTIIFSNKNANLIPNNFVISIDELRDISVKYNKKNKNGVFTSMGFAPRWSAKFLYTLAKMQGANFTEAQKVFTWDSVQLASSVEYIKNWTLSNNDSSSTEDDYAFKYLYMPEYKLILQNRCLFEFTTSDKFFSLPEEKIAGIDYRWLHYNNKTPVDDNVVFLGLYRKSKNIDNAENFILWFMKEDTQRKIIERNKKMKLNTATFGIVGGFSSIYSVNEKVLTQTNPILMKNLPIAEYLAPINVLPARWENIKESVLYPYMTEATNTTKQVTEQQLNDSIQKWSKQIF